MGGGTDSGTLARFRLHHDIGTLPQSNLRDLEALPPLPPSLYPPLQALQCNAIQRLERTPAGRTAHGRNQDKTRVIVLHSTGHGEIDLSARTS
jgi:hypothetical protein